MKNFFKKYVKFNSTNVNIVICAIAMIISICTGNYWDICGWLSAFCAWILVAFIENWNDELLNERFELERKLTELHITNDVLKLQEENERLQKLLNEMKNK